MSPDLRPALRSYRLVFSDDGMPGYSRARRGTGFSFRLPDGTPLKDTGERQRILSLAIPPAYESVWICMKGNGHLQATGIDARGRKQYRYHPAWAELSSDRKFLALPAFARALPGLRAKTAAALHEDGFSRDRVIAGIVALLDATGFRIGGKRYVDENKSYGLASLLSRHLTREEGGWHMRFRGKSGQDHRARIRHAGINELIAGLHELPGQHLFRYEDQSGALHDVSSTEVNDWIQSQTGGSFSAKQFRTWRATTHCARLLAAEPPGETKAAMKRAEMAAIRATAGMLRHTPATCRKYYIHPAILRAYRSGRLFSHMTKRPPKFPPSDPANKLRADERRTLRLLETPGKTKPPA